MENIVQLNFEDLQAIIKVCLKDAVAEIKAIPDPPKLSDRCTLPEACEITGLSPSLIYKKSMDGSIPKEKYGKRLVFSRKTLLEWMEQRTTRKQSPEETMTKHLQKEAQKRIR